MNDQNEQDELLRIYLTDHAAGATAGSRRAARLAEAGADSADGAALATLADDVATDREALVALMTSIDSSRAS